jgi:tRNA threonylcarbamoyladenosine biosynthesis protein TsaB
VNKTPPTSEELRWTLAIETSTLTMSVALLDGQTLVEERVVYTPRGHAMIVLPEVASLLAKASIENTDLDLVVMSTGPGSFTGIRIGMATARGMIRATGSHGVGVGSLEVLASTVLPGEGLVVTALDARRSEVFGAVYRSRGVDADPEIVMSPTVASPVEFAQAVRALSGDKPLCVGSGFVRYPELTGELGGKRGEVDDDVIHAEIAARIGRRRVLAGDAMGEASMQPVYLRRSDAEINMGPPTGEATIEHR